MNRAYRLYELQRIDLQIDVGEQELAHIRERIGENLAILGLRQVLEEGLRQAKELEERRRSLEWDSEDLRAKITPLEEKLYSGRVKNPKELLALQQDVEMLAGKRQGIENAELEVMMELEELQDSLRQKRQELAAMEKDWKETQEQLSSRERALLQELESLRAQRQALASGIEAGILERYELIREKRQGLAVVTVERGTCVGCHIAVTAMEMQRARQGADLVFCQSCGRILYVS